MAERTYSASEVAALVNAACNDVVEFADLPETGAVDALNLLVNVVAHRAETDQAGLSANPVDAQEAFDQEVKVYGLWANGEVYGSAHVAKRGDEPDMVFGHLGYEDNADIASNYTDSPIVEVLA